MSEINPIRKRSEIAKEDTWAVEDLYATEELWEQELATLSEDYTVIITADHGGHDRTHGTDLPEDMTIPLFIMGENFEPGTKLENVSILDIAPTIADVLGAPPDAEWEGKSLKR